MAHPRRVIITGSSGGFGRATSDLLQARGMQVVGLDVRPASDAEFACDITDVEAVRVAVAAAVERLGGLDVLVNNAGIGTAASIAHGVDALAREVMEINVFGTWNVTAAALPHLLAARGQVINVASMLAVANLPRVAAYCASKRAVCALSDVLRAEHGRGELAVTTIYPGYVPTAIHDEPERRSGLSLAGRVPLESAEQVARTFLRAIERRPRDLATSRTGTFALHLGRRSPRLLDAMVRARLRRDPLPPDTPVER